MLISSINDLTIELKALVELTLPRFIIPWDEKLGNLAKKLMRVFQLENDYYVITRLESFGSLDDEYYHKYTNRIIMKCLESLLKRLEELYPEIQDFLTFTRGQLQQINNKLHEIHQLIEKHAKDPEYEDFFNALAEYLLFVQNVQDEIAYDVSVKQTILDELSNELLQLDKKNLELLRFYMICLQNHALGAEINVIVEALQFGYNLSNYHVDPVPNPDENYHNQFLRLISKIDF